MASEEEGSVGYRQKHMMNINFNEHNTINLSWIGGAASTLLSLPYFIRGLKEKPLAGVHSLNICIFDPHGLNPGLAYRVSNPGFCLNQPAGKDMDAFHEAGPGLPLSFLHWLNGSDYRANQNSDYTEHSFVPRRAFGDYLLYVRDWISDEISSLPYVHLHEIKQHVKSIETLIPKNGGAKYYNLLTEKGDLFRTHGYTLATGHSFQLKLDQPHNQYLAAYVDHDFEARLANLAKTTDAKRFIGSGASMTDIICALEHMGHQGQYIVISPHGNTGWRYNPDSPRPHNDAVNAYILPFLSSSDTFRNTTLAIRRLLNVSFEHGGIAPQYILGALLEHPQVISEPSLRKPLEAFYGNPHSSQRFDQINQLERIGRLEYKIDRVDRLQPQQGALEIIYRSGASETIRSPIIDCAVVRRGIPQSGLVPHLIGQKTLPVSTKNPQILEMNPVPFELVFAIGTLRNSHKNGIGTFRQDYQEAPSLLLNYLSLSCAHRARYAFTAFQTPLYHCTHT